MVRSFQVPCLLHLTVLYYPPLAAIFKLTPYPLIQALFVFFLLVTLGSIYTKLMLRCPQVPILLHLTVLYYPPLAAIFKLTPLVQREWAVVAAFALPLVLLEEILKLISRSFSHD